MLISWLEDGLQFRTTGLYPGPLECWLNGRWVIVLRARR